jgi:hypothetical protein
MFSIHHRHMALQPKSALVSPFWGFLTITILRDWVVSPAPNPQPGGPGLRIYDPRRQGGPAIPPGTGYTFSHLLRHTWVTVGLFFNPGHHTGCFPLPDYNSESPECTVLINTVIIAVHLCSPVLKVCTLHWSVLARYNSSLLTES